MWLFSWLQSLGLTERLILLLACKLYVESTLKRVPFPVMVTTLLDSPVKFYTFLGERGAGPEGAPGPPQTLYALQAPEALSTP